MDDENRGLGERIVRRPWPIFPVHSAIIPLKSVALTLKRTTIVGFDVARLIHFFLPQRERKGAPRARPIKNRSFGDFSFPEPGNLTQISCSCFLPIEIRAEGLRPSDDLRRQRFGCQMAIQIGRKSLPTGGRAHRPFLSKSPPLACLGAGKEIKEGHSPRTEFIRSVTANKANFSRSRFAMMRRAGSVIRR